jgi:hypothetical protein
MKLKIFLLTLVAMPLQAQTTFFSDAMGLPLGTANRVGNTTFYSNAMGLPLGTAQTPQTVAPIQNYAPSYSTPSAPLFPTAPMFPTSPRGM